MPKALLSFSKTQPYSCKVSCLGMSTPLIKTNSIVVPDITPVLVTKAIHTDTAMHLFVSENAFLSSSNAFATQRSLSKPGSLSYS